MCLFKKLLGLVLTVASVFTLMPSVASADSDTLVKGNTGIYSYVLYKNGLLDVVCKDYCFSINYVKSEFISEITKVNLDITDVPETDGEQKFIFIGNNSNIVEINIVDNKCSERSYSLVSIGAYTGDFVKLTLPEGFKTGVLNLIGSYTDLNDVIKIPDIYRLSLQSDTTCRKLVIPASVEELLVYGFSRLTEIDLSACSKLHYLSLIGSAITEFSIPDTITTLDDQAFRRCSRLKRIDIPAGVTSIDVKSFEDCSSLEDVYYGGTESDWNEITVTPSGSIYEIFGEATIHFAQVSGWKQKGSNWYYYNDNSERVTGWSKINNAWYFFDSKGVMLKGWQQISGVWYYLGSNGSMRTGWQNISGSWYYFGDNGSMKTGWQKVGSFWYYFGDSGSMKTGWQNVGGKWYFFESSGEMATSWKQISGIWYYLDPSSGAMVTGWKSVGGNWYYLETGGAMKTGWLKLDGIWYYLDPSSGAMVTGSKAIGGKTYNFDSSGKCTNP